MYWKISYDVYDNKIKIKSVNNANVVNNIIVDKDDEFTLFIPHADKQSDSSSKIEALKYAHSLFNNFFSNITSNLKEAFDKTEKDIIMGDYKWYVVKFNALTKEFSLKTLISEPLIHPNIIIEKDTISCFVFAVDEESAILDASDKFEKYLKDKIHNIYNISTNLNIITERRTGNII